jgi:putative ABC transport system substrate-binding protein
VLTNPNNYGSTAQLERIQAAATILGFKPVAIRARSRNELASALASISAQRFDALIVLSDSIMIANTGSIAQHALKAGVPSISAYRFYPEAGGLMSYGPDWSTLWKQCAVYADRIFKGSNPAELPVEQPSKFEFVVNQKTAKTIGITIPQGIIMRADEVIR